MEKDWFGYYKIGPKGEDVLFVPGCFALVGKKDMIKIDYEPEMLAYLNKRLIKNKKGTNMYIEQGIVKKAQIEDFLIKEFNDLVWQNKDDEAVMKAVDILDYVKEEIEELE